MRVGWIGERLAELTLSGDKDVFSVVRLTPGSTIRIGRRSNSIAILFPAIMESTLEPDLRLANLHVTNRTRCRIRESGNVRVLDFAVVECVSPEKTVQATFIDVLEWLLPDDQEVSVDELREVVSTLVLLFSAGPRIARTSVIGLWGELFLMDHSLSIDALATAWHRSPMDRWDFSRPGLRVEVKTTVGARRHHFSLEQLMPPADVDLYVVSILTEESGSGTTLEEMLQRIALRIGSSELRSKVVSTALSSLGDSWQEGKRIGFDEELAAQTLRLLDGRDIPKVAIPPVEVTGVSFISDVEDVLDVGLCRLENVMRPQ